MPNDAPMPAGAPPPTFVPIPDPVAQGQPAQGQPYQQQQQENQTQFASAPPQAGYYPAGTPVPAPPPTVYYVSAMPGYIMRPPRVPPQPGMVITCYESKY
jgi:hypothetical protein